MERDTFPPIPLQNLLSDRVADLSQKDESWAAFLYFLYGSLYINNDWEVLTDVLCMHTAYTVGQVCLHVLSFTVLVHMVN